MQSDGPSGTIPQKSCDCSSSNGYEYISEMNQEAMEEGGPWCVYVIWQMLSKVRVRTPTGVRVSVGTPTGGRPPG